jgi:hypothetical protein
MNPVFSPALHSIMIPSKIDCDSNFSAMRPESQSWINGLTI